MYIAEFLLMLKANVKNINDETNQFGKNLCMHIAASKPLANDIEDLDKSIIENEKDVQLSLIKSSGKPEKIINKILDGKMNKYFVFLAIYLKLIVSAYSNPNINARTGILIPHLSLSGLNFTRQSLIVF